MRPGERHRVNFPSRGRLSRPGGRHRVNFASRGRPSRPGGRARVIFPSLPLFWVTLLRFPYVPYVSYVFWVAPGAPGAPGAPPGWRRAQGLTLAFSAAQDFFTRGKVWVEVKIPVIPNFSPCKEIHENQFWFRKGRPVDAMLTWWRPPGRHVRPRGGMFTRRRPFIYIKCPI